MDSLFPAIFVIMMVCLLLECLSLLLSDFGMALACRLIVLMLLYLSYTLRRDLVYQALKKRSRKLLEFYSYTLFICATASVVFNAFLIYFISFKLYCLCVVLISLPVALDEYQEIEWLRERQRSYKQLTRPSDERHQALELETGEADLRTSLYYTVFKQIQLYPAVYRVKAWLVPTEIGMV